MNIFDVEDISNFIPDYPSPKDKNFSFDIARRKEFLKLKLEPSENIPIEAGVPLLSQKLQERFFSPHTQFTSGLFFHGMGVGKTCASSLIIENFKSVLSNGRERQPALVIVPSEDLARSYRKEVSQRCTKDIYIPKLTAEEIRAKERGDIKEGTLTYERRLRAAIAKSYEIVTMQIFLSNLQRDELVIERYSNRVIIVDEAHFLRIQPKKQKKESAMDAFRGLEPRVTLEMYNKMHHFLHIIKNCRIFLLTGTPIWDRVYEIASLMNLILPIDQNLPTKTNFIKEYFDDDGNLSKEGAKKLKKVLRGKVSYLRLMMTTAKREEMGVKLPWLKYVSVYPSAMSPFQYKYSKEAEERVDIVPISYKSKKTGKIVTKDREVKGGPVRMLARDASTFIFPKFSDNGKVIGGEYGPKAFKKNITLVQGGKRYKYVDKRTAKEVRENIKRYSAKIASIIAWLQDHPDECVFIFDESVAAGGGGAINLGLILEQHGYVWIKKESSMRKPDERGRKRFAVISSDNATTSNSGDIEALITSFNKPDNKYGERCQIIIGSKKIALGLTIKNVRQVHIVMPHWNIPSIDQALGRIFRVGSHNAFDKKEERYIRIFRHASVKGEKDGFNYGKGFPENSSFSGEKTMDIIVYEIAENKEHYNTQIYRLLKEISWDCPLTYKRNVLEEDQDFTRSCDYSKCNYICDDYTQKYIDKNAKVWNYVVPNNKIISTNYDLFYSREDVMEMIEKIKALFDVYFSIDLSLLIKLLHINPGEHSLLLKSLNTVISSRLKIKNRYGVYCYLKEQNNMYFLEDTIGENSSYLNSFYTSNPYIIKRVDLEDISEIIQLKENYRNVEEFCNNPSSSSLDRMNYRSLIVLLENSYERKYSKLTKKQRKIVDTVLNTLGSNIIELEGVAIHNMYPQEYTGLGYNVTVKEIKPTGLLRIFENDVGKWRYADKDEEETYLKYLKGEKIEKRESVWENNPLGIYGFRDKDNKFKIRVKEKPGKRPTKGSVCVEGSWSVMKIYELFKKIGYIPTKGIKGKINRKEAIKNIRAQPFLKIFSDDLEKRTDKELQGILKLHELGNEKLCELLEEWFIENNLFYDKRT